MAWIESHQSLGKHPKLLRLARELNISHPQAVGHLSYLWWWALEYAPSGDLSKFDCLEIADAANWLGEANQFYSALKSNCWIDPDSKLHDWSRYAGPCLMSRIRQKEYRERRVALYNANITNTVATTTTIPNLTIPNLTIPNLTIPNQSNKAAAPRQPKRFEKPTAEQVTAYAKEQLNYVLDGQRFVDYYEGKGWVIGRSPMKDWKACVRTWKQNQGGFGIGKTESAVGKTGGFVPTKQPLF